MFDKFETPRELFAYKLGSALKMEDVVLETLGKLEANAQSEELKGQFRHHAAETRQQIANLKQVFATLDEKPDEPVPGHACHLARGRRQHQAHQGRGGGALAAREPRAGAAHPHGGQAGHAHRRARLNGEGRIG
jgi:hypothetical protein